ncbi:MAG TPA: hypothetical protein VH592_10420 [Gemmataceae bacterium]|jgi:hypothetical protein
MASDFWKDYCFMLLEGEPVKRFERTLLNPLDMPKPPYRETHKGETGIVFFPTLEAARAYKRVRKLEGYNVLHVFPEYVEGFISASMQLWECNVAFSIRQEGNGFRRDVTTITESEPTVEDGQHRLKK